jgi:hypothetical protein
MSVLPVTINEFADIAKSKRNYIEFKRINRYLRISDVARAIKATVQLKHSISAIIGIGSAFKPPKIEIVNKKLFFMIPYEEKIVSLPNDYDFMVLVKVQNLNDKSYNIPILKDFCGDYLSFIDMCGQANIHITSVDESKVKADNTINNDVFKNGVLIAGDTDLEFGGAGYWNNGNFVF